jgi:Ca2+:H+ antiporter
MSATVPVYRPSNAFSELFPWSTCLRLATAWAVVIAFEAGGERWLSESLSATSAAVSFVVLFSTILIASFGVAREADNLADKLGEPYGTLILTLSVVMIEVILIVAVMVGPGQTETIARDSIFAVMMIIMNLVTGSCVLLGGLRHGEQEYNSQGAVAYLSIIVLLTGTALVLPNLVSSGNGIFAPAQAIAFTVLTVTLYAAFLVMQMKGSRRFFIQPEKGALAIPAHHLSHASAADPAKTKPSFADKRTVFIRSFMLIALFVPVAVLAHDLAILINLGVEHAGAPAAFGGVLIAVVVFAPESITAVRASLANQMQRTMNLCFGAFVSTVGLTVPAVLAIGLIIDKTVILGLGAVDTALLVLTVVLTTLTFLGVRTSPVQGLMHLGLFAVYVVLLIHP